MKSPTSKYRAVEKSMKKSKKYEEQRRGFILEKG